MLPEILRAAVLLDASDPGEGEWSATWPEDRDSGALLPLARGCLNQNRKGGRITSQIHLPPETPRCYLFHPLYAEEHLYGVMALEILPGQEGRLESLPRFLDWGALWLQFARQLKLGEGESELLRLIRLHIACIEPKTFALSALGFVQRLAQQTACSRVSLGLWASGQARLVALSNSAAFDPRSAAASLLTAAMEEAVDQARSLGFPPAGAIQGSCAPTPNSPGGMRPTPC